MIGTVKDRVDQQIKGNGFGWTMRPRRLCFGINTFNQFIRAGGICSIDYGEKDLKYNGIPVHVVKKRENYFRIIKQKSLYLNIKEGTPVKWVIPDLKELLGKEKYEGIVIKPDRDDYKFKKSLMYGGFPSHIKPIKYNVLPADYNPIYITDSLDALGYTSKDARVNKFFYDRLKSIGYKTLERINSGGIDANGSGGEKRIESDKGDKAAAQDGAMGSLLCNVQRVGQAGATGSANAL